jgi:hypothetical protein
MRLASTHLNAALERFVLLCSADSTIYEPGTDTPAFKQMFERIKEYAVSQGLAGIEFIPIKSV